MWIIANKQREENSRENGKKAKRAAAADLSMTAGLINVINDATIKSTRRTIYLTS